MKEIYENTWAELDKGVRFFLLTGTERALVIDTGMNGVDIRGAVSAHTGLPLTLLNTHADRDHIGSNAEFERFCMHPDEEPVYRRSGLGGVIVPVRDGDELDLGGRRLRILHLPGHTPGSIAVLDVKNRVLISGDPIQAHGRIYMFGAHRDLAAYIRSLDRLSLEAGSFDEIWPSHADLPLSPAVIRPLRDGAQAILDGTITGTPAELHGLPIMACDLGFCTLLCDPSVGKEVKP